MSGLDRQMTFDRQIVLTQLTSPKRLTSVLTGSAMAYKPPGIEIAVSFESPVIVSPFGDDGGGTGGRPHRAQGGKISGS
jgi:hypothetical protein